MAAALERHGIRAVLTGGACAALHSGGAVQSYDLDFILQVAVPKRKLDESMASIGFAREGRHYRHPSAMFFVEFPAGPLGIGNDINIRPTSYQIGSVTVWTLSPTDSCRDRLAAFYHWNDRQSLVAAVQIARRSRVNIRRIRTWSIAEGALGPFEEFTRLLKTDRYEPRR